jgi:hypothetical protein
MLRFLRHVVLGGLLAGALLLASPAALHAQWSSTYYYPGGYSMYHYGYGYPPFYGYSFQRYSYPGVYAAPAYRAYRPYGYCR